MTTEVAVVHTDDKEKVFERPKPRSVGSLVANLDTQLNNSQQQNTIAYMTNGHSAGPGNSGVRFDELNNSKNFQHS